MNIFSRNDTPRSFRVHMTLLPETVYTHGGESDEPPVRDPDRYLGIIIAGRSSQARTRGGGSWEERSARRVHARFISATLDPDREDSVRSRREMFPRFSFADEEEHRAKVRMSVPLSTSLSSPSDLSIDRP